MPRARHFCALPRRVTVLSLPFLLLAACAAPQLPLQQPGAQPDKSSPEAGMWMQMEQVEHQIATSGVRMPGPIEEYVSSVACRVAAEYCPDIRVYLLDVPEFNATMAPNGVMTVWSGLLLRVENEAQLATVLGHEVAHYKRRHSLQRWIETKNTVNALTAIQFAALFGGVAYASEVSQLTAAGYMASHSRQDEAESDDDGIRAIAAVGYDPREAAKIWQGLIDEREASDDPEPLPFFASHPASEKRAEVLAQTGDFLYDPTTTSDTGQERFNATLLPIRAKLLRAELRQRRFERTQILLDRLIEDGNRVGELYFFQGELHRLRSDQEQEDLRLALEAYDQALDVGGAPATTHRSRGIVLRAMDRKDEAAEAFRAYLEAAPEAGDRAMVEAYIERLE